MSGQPRRPRARLVRVEPDRFAAGWRLLDEPGFEFPPVGSSPDVVVDLVRPDDLVAFTLEAYDLELFGGARPHLRPKNGGDARLVVRFAYQHLGELALVDADPPPPHTPPIEARPARSSRVVLAVAQGERIEFSTEGILEALGRLPMLVHPFATPRPSRSRRLTARPVLHLPGGLIARVGPSELVVEPAGRGLALPDPSTRDGLLRLVRDGRRVRALLAARAGTAVSGMPFDDDAPVVVVDLDGTATDVVGLIGPGLFEPDLHPRVRRPRLSRPTQPFETSIEAPYRLQITPSALEGWHHATTPVTAKGAPARVEVWHSRLGVRVVRDNGDVTVRDRRHRQRVIRAVWARDRESPELFELQDPPPVPFPDWQDLRRPGDTEKPFLMSLSPGDRHKLVRQSTESWIGKDGSPIPPVPVAATKLWLSALGAWLDLHGEWDITDYAAAEITSIVSWDHLAPEGRDQFVRVVYPGFLFPFGHFTTLVKITERKLPQAAASIAGLYQRRFLAVSEPLREYDLPNLPFDEIGVQPLTTPPLDGSPGPSQPFLPVVDGKRFVWVLHYIDKEGRPGRLETPLVWVPAAFTNEQKVLDLYKDISSVPASGQQIAYAAARDGGETVVATESLHFSGSIDDTLISSTPKLTGADVHIPAVQHLSALPQTIPIKYWDTFVADGGFGGSANPGEIWAEVTDARKLQFGANQEAAASYEATAGSDKAGGFLQPNLELGGLSRIKGTVGNDLDQIAKGTFNPAAFLGSALPRLFGIVELDQILDAAGFDEMPDIVSQQLGQIEGFMADLERAKAIVEDAISEAQLLQQRVASKSADLQQQAADALADAQQLRDDVVAAADDVIDTLGNLIGQSQANVTAAIAAPLQAIRDVIPRMEQLAPKLPPLVRQQLLSIADVLRTVADAADVIEDVVRFVHQIAAAEAEFTFRYEWRPTLHSWPTNGPMLILPKDGLVLSVEGRAAKDDMRVQVLAELKDFSLQLFGKEPLVRFDFDHLSFRGGSEGKPDVDVVLQKITFLGLLGFIETLRDLIPFDGFSDPPFLDVTSEGMTAGFTLALPNVSIGVFNLSNMSLGADVQVPFLGKAVTVGFNFCTRERPFTIAVVFIGGGGWFLLRLSPDGLDVLELGLEAGAILAVDFGVASGSISAMLGIYMRLEGEKGSLSGYFRLRGEVDVLGLISASIELYLELHYEFDTGKMIGSAKLTIKVEVFFFSTSVTLTCERQFAGSKGDPSFADVMVEEDGSSPAWSEYCLAFAGE